MTPDQVTLSRRAASVLGYLNAESAKEFRGIVVLHGSIDSVPLPYQSWLRDPRQIPESARARLADPTTGERVVREIPDNPFA